MAKSATIPRIGVKRWLCKPMTRDWSSSEKAASAKNNPRHRLSKNKMLRVAPALAFGSRFSGGGVVASRVGGIISGGVDNGAARGTCSTDEGRASGLGSINNRKLGAEWHYHHR